MHNQILLTGATGALGPALAAQLARAQAARRIAILMRASPAELPHRFARWVDDVRPLLTPDERPALATFFPVSGDICQPNLGFASDDSLRAETDIVIHAAADTNFAATHDRQWAVNVDGTRHMLDWSARCPNLRRFLLVSSVFVSGSRTGTIHETATNEAPEFVTHYQRTKWESERIALSDSLPLAIARISMVLGSHATGDVHRFGAVHSLIKWFARGLIPMVPGNPEARGDIIATETAALCLTRATLAPWPPSTTQKPIWHIAAAEHAPRMTEVIDFVHHHFSQRPAWRRKNIPQPQMVEQQEFNRLIQDIDASGHAVLSQALRSVNGFLPELFYPKTYQTTQAEALWGGPLPQYDWRETLERVIHFCCPPAPRK